MINDYLREDYLSIFFLLKELMKFNYKKRRLTIIVKRLSNIVYNKLFSKDEDTH